MAGKENGLCGKGSCGGMKVDRLRLGQLDQVAKQHEVERSLVLGRNPEEILLLWNQGRTEVAGFCMVSVEENQGWPGAADGGLGPIGIGKGIRGNHVGSYLLWGSLQQLKRLGAGRVNIDWTILKDFYGQFDFFPARFYQAAYKEL